MELLILGEESSNPAYVETFVATHNYFVDSQTFMTRLMERFYDGDEGKIMDVFRIWIELYVEDFTEENSILFSMFLQDIRTKGDEFLKYATELDGLYNKQRDISEAKRLRLAALLAREAALATHLGLDRPRGGDEEEGTSLPLSEEMVLLKISGLLEKSFSPMAIAQQLAIAEREMFREIPLREYLFTAWSKTNKGEPDRGKQLARLIQRSNKVSFWVATAILTVSSSAKKRTKLIGLFALVGEACLQIQNYQSAMQIYSGLNITPVQRLKPSWKGLSKKHQDAYDRLATFFDNSSNFKNYRDAVKACQAPAIPLLSLILSDLTMIEENDNHLENGELIHFEKMSMIYDTLSILKRLLTTPYTFAGVDPTGGGDVSCGDAEDLAEMVTSLPHVGERELYEFKGDRDKQKVNEYKKAFKAALKARGKPAKK
eukprot:TRINITY_DN8235_c2_g1_i2.p2 TRINITY_DN8235_c2_g1~~TRINITY_DN8235_c2_g1_i2.p2  ORF type:complete len:430 (-),score=92.43 TRINITY_DN8235_c2_g1_i2:32-1321(-)